MTTKVWIRNLRPPIKIKLVDIAPIIVRARVHDALVSYTTKHPIYCRIVDANYNPLCVLLEEKSFRNFETNMYVPKFPKVYDGSQKLSKVTKSLYLLDSPPISNYFTFTETGLA
jgi:hypothetical protein